MNFNKSKFAILVSCAPMTGKCMCLNKETNGAYSHRAVRSQQYMSEHLIKITIQLTICDTNPKTRGNLHCDVQRI